MPWTLTHTLNPDTCLRFWYISWILIHVLKTDTCPGSWYIFWILIHVLDPDTCFGWSRYMFCTLIHVLKPDTYPLIMSWTLIHALDPDACPGSWCMSWILTHVMDPAACHWPWLKPCSVPPWHGRLSVTLICSQQPYLASHLRGRPSLSGNIPSTLIIASQSNKPYLTLGLTVAWCCHHKMCSTFIAAAIASPSSSHYQWVDARQHYLLWCASCERRFNAYYFTYALKEYHVYCLSDLGMVVPYITHRSVKITWITLLYCVILYLLLM